MRGKAVIAGIGHTAFGKQPGRSTVSLNIEACRKAVADAGIEKDAIDGLLVKVPTSKVEMMYGQKLAEAMGMSPRVGGVFDQGGASNISMIAIAAMAIEAGQCEVALVTLADNPRTGSRHAYEKVWGDDADFGWSSVVAGYAMIARRYMHDHGDRRGNQPHDKPRRHPCHQRASRQPFVAEDQAKYQWSHNCEKNERCGSYPIQAGERPVRKIGQMAISHRLWGAREIDLGHRVADQRDGCTHCPCRQEHKACLRTDGK